MCTIHKHVESCLVLIKLSWLYSLELEQFDSMVNCFSMCSFATMFHSLYEWCAGLFVLIFGLALNFLWFFCILKKKHNTNTFWPKTKVKWKLNRYLTLYCWLPDNFKANLQNSHKFHAMGQNLLPEQHIFLSLEMWKTKINSQHISAFNTIEPHSVVWYFSQSFDVSTLFRVKIVFLYCCSCC